ncbi:hypothetical protein [Wocania ichthyoenteri]|uniref:hypothetical protein n=1 Tax=Wocania ichthyoenteri TaxID=1230531 RepID=UPI00053F05DC|nr:hypothetical protein [Wocania ichthyoenteri]
MSEKFITIKEVALNNNCPECYSKDGLRLTFKQKLLETKFYKSITKEISHSITCETCNTTIYPVRWTDDIERVFEYQKKAFVPKKASTYLKKLSWIVIIFIAIVITATVFTVLYTKL